MEANSLEFSFLSIFLFISFFITLCINKYLTKKGSILSDSDFLKPQAFHSIDTPRSGGLAAIVSLLIFFVSQYYFFETFMYDYFIISISLFFIGFFDDIKVNFSPVIRLSLMVFILSICIYYFSINLVSVDLLFLNIWLSNKFFNLIFILLCFLFIINGANLIDGFNGLLGIHILIINFILLAINLNTAGLDFLIFLMAQIIILIIFLLFNFPKAKLFLGDGGSYLFGSLTVLNVINTNNVNYKISSFFFCAILFYLFFEVFFSFFRKLSFKRSPLQPDANHLHMLTYRWLKKLNKFENCNHLNSLLINLVYTVLILPAIYFSDNGIFCRYWFFFLLFLYIYVYIKLYNSFQN